MKKRKTFLFAVSTLFLAALGKPVKAEEFQMTDCSKASGYYYTEEAAFVFMDNGTVYEINSETLAAEKTKESYTVFSNGKDFIITLGEDALYLQEQSEKGITEEGERYYAVYSDFEGTIDQANYQEGSNFLVDDYYLFGMHYTVARRQSIGRFLNIESNEIAGSFGTYEEVGFDTPEEAVNAYLEAFQKKDVEGMLSTFAMDTYVEHFRLDKQIERLSSYKYNMGLPNSNEYIWQLSKEQRRALLTNALIGAYWRYAAPELAYGIPELISGSGEEFLAESFYNEGYIDTITLTGTFLNPTELEPNYESYCQKMYTSWLEINDGNEIRDIVAVLSIENRDFIQCMSVIRYGEKWYNLQLSGNIGSLLGIPDSYAGLISLEELQDADY